MDLAAKRMKFTAQVSDVPVAIISHVYSYIDTVDVLNVRLCDRKLMYAASLSVDAWRGKMLIIKQTY
jgi:hypothetical protein